MLTLFTTDNNNNKQQQQQTTTTTGDKVIPTRVFPTKAGDTNTTFFNKALTALKITQNDYLNKCLYDILFEEIT